MLLIVLLAAPAHAKTKYKQQPVYIFGYALSPTDSIIYVTDIQRIDTAYVEKKNGYMLARPNYSLQLQTFLATNYETGNAICNIFFSTKREKLEKKYDRITVRAKNSEDDRLCLLGSQVFTFRNEPYTPDDYEEPQYVAPTVKPKKK